MKGQTGIEFIVGVSIFLVTISYALLTIINNMPVYHDYAITEDLLAKAYQVSDFLTFENLSTGVRYQLDPSKISQLGMLCANEAGMRNAFGLGQKDIVVKIAKLNGDTVLDCKTVGSITGKNLVVRRYAILNGDIVWVDVSIV